RRAAFNALVVYLGLDVSQLAEMEEVLRYAALARALMERIPAFRPLASRPVSRIDYQLFVSDWTTIAGHPPGLLADPTSFYEALFVQTVNQLCEKKQSSRIEAFRWIANETAKTRRPAEAQRRRDLLPRPFRKLKTSNSLKYRFDSIPK